MADTHYGSDDNYQKAKGRGVQLVAPIPGAPKAQGISPAEFETTEEAPVVACPRGHAPAKDRQRKRLSFGFAPEPCEPCGLLASCPGRRGQKDCYRRFTGKQLRIAARRSAERSEQFEEHYRFTIPSRY